MENLTEILFTVPFIIRVFLSLIIILLFNKLIKNLLFAVFMGTFALAFWCGHSPAQVMEITWAQFLSINNIFLLIIIALVIILSSQMSESGVMKELVSTIGSHVSKRTAMAILPAVIGFLPMPGGALFSAPLVDDTDPEKNVSGLLKTKINYWFRHVWEYWWPLYPGVLLTIEITGIPLWQLIILQFPLCLCAILAGYLIFLRKIKKTEKKNQRGDSNIIQLLLLLLPIIVVIVVYIFISIRFPFIAVINKYFPMAIGILVSIIVLQIQRPLSLTSWKKILFSSKTLNMMAVVFLIRIYGAFISTALPDNTFLMDNVRMELNMLGIPLILMVMIIPFISGITTGITLGFVGASFPIIINLLGPSPEPGLLLSMTVVAYASGYIGIMLSPVHVCLIVTNEYFKTSLSKTLYMLIPPCLFVLAGAFLMYYIVGNIF